MTRNNRPDDELRAWLRRGDPALDGRRPTDEEVGRMRRRVLDATPGPPLFRPWVAISTIAAAAVLAALLLMPVGTMQPPDAGSPETGAEEPAARQIRFTTDRGTRIVWTLDPEFEF